MQNKENSTQTDFCSSPLRILDVNELIEISDQTSSTAQNQSESPSPNVLDITMSTTTPAMATSTPLDITVDHELEELGKESEVVRQADDRRPFTDADNVRQALQRLLAGSGTITDDIEQRSDMDDTDEEDDWAELQILDVQSLAQMPQPLYPMGPLKYKECIVCLEMKDLNLRTCCSEAVCEDCVMMYISVQIEQANVKIGCPYDNCDQYIHRDEVMTRLTGELKEKYQKFLVDANKEPHIKTCPRCSAITKIDPGLLKRSSVRKKGLRKTCTVCSLDWCFPCQAPWHNGIKCKTFRRGDRQLKTWAKSKQFGQTNAQRCPKCKIYIQRSSGCDHMTCTKCRVDFCYRCGERHISIKFLGDHYTRLSIFGCKYRFLPNSPVRRKLTRGTIFAAKLALLPLLATAAVCVGAVVLAVGIFVLPVWGGIQIHKRVKAKRRRKEDRIFREMWRTKLHALHTAGDPYIENFNRHRPQVNPYINDLNRYRPQVRAPDSQTGVRDTLIVDELDMKQLSAVLESLGEDIDQKSPQRAHADSISSSMSTFHTSDYDEDFINNFHLGLEYKPKTKIQVPANNIDIHAIPTSHQLDSHEPDNNASSVERMEEGESPTVEFKFDAEKLEFEVVKDEDGNKQSPSKHVTQDYLGEQDNKLLTKPKIVEHAELKPVSRSKWDENKVKKLVSQYSCVGAEDDDTSALKPDHKSREEANHHKVVLAREDSVGELSEDDCTNNRLCPQQDRKDIVTYV